MYDVVIIGAGISGLVCGCYLAKAGMKVLIVEQHTKPGGYCTSFKRQGFTFDAAAHSFGSYRENGNMRLVLKELGLESERDLCIERVTPSDVFITPDFKIAFGENVEKSIEELQKIFPKESDGIRKYIRYLVDSKPIDFIKLRKITYKNLLDQYFKDDRLKAVFAMPVLGNGALPPSLISAFTGAKIFTEFILDGGYYPVGGMQTLSDVLSKCFKQFGGKLQLSCLAKEIRVKNNIVEGIVLDNGEFIKSKYVVSNSDAKHTFLELLGKKVIDQHVLETIESLIPSLSLFILYLGIDKCFESLPKAGVNVWYMPHFDIEKMYLSAKNRSANNLDAFMVRLSPDKKTMLAFTNSDFKDKDYWIENKQKFIDTFIRKIEGSVIEGLEKHIRYRDAATPYTLFRYTLNYKGAAYGWATFPKQLFAPELRQSTMVEGLFLTGHWTTQTQGIPGVAYLGYNVAKLLLRREKRI